MRTLFNLVRLLIAIVTQLPFALFYIFASGKLKEVVKIDIHANALNSSVLPPPPVGFAALCLLLFDNQYFKSLYCHRIRRMRLSQLLPHRHFLLEIPYDVRIGAGLKLDHPFSTILNAKEIGCNCRIKNNITIGNKNDDESLRPVIGDNVYIGAGAIIIGNISIGSDSKIGAGAVVTKDVPPGSVVVGNPIRFL